MLYTTSLSAQKVKYATKLFSRSNALALRRAGDLKLFNGPTWKMLSDILLLVNNWFDIFNSKVGKVEPKEKWHLGWPIKRI